MKRVYDHSVSNGPDDGNLHSVRAQTTIPNQSAVETVDAGTETATLRNGHEDIHLEKPSVSNNHDVVVQETAGAVKRPKIGTASVNNDGQAEMQQPSILHVLQRAKDLVDFTENHNTSSNVKPVLDGPFVSNSGASEHSPEQNRAGAVMDTQLVSSTTPPNTRLTGSQQESPPVDARVENQKQPPAAQKQSSKEKVNTKSHTKADENLATNELTSTTNGETAKTPKTRRGSATSSTRPSSSTLTERRSVRAKSIRATDGASPTENTEMETANETESQLSSNGDAVDQTTAAESGEVVAQYISLPALPRKVPELPRLRTEEMRELEGALEFGANSGDTWREDWSGNLAYADKEISNPIVKGKSSGKTDFKQSLLQWATNGPRYIRLLQYLVRYVYHQHGTPSEAKKIIANANQGSVDEIENAIRRVSYDPTVLRQDGWTTEKSKEMIGATGGPFLIGDLILWQNNEAVVIAYVHDQDDLGDLWKAMYLDDMETFDLEAEELQSARQKWERKHQKQSTSAPSVDNNSRRSTRTVAITSNFDVPGMEHGIVLAASYNPNARQGVFWPARVMHVSEMDNARTQSKRVSSRKALVDVVFLAPYWNSRNVNASSRGRVESFADSISRHGKAIFNSGPLFEIETIEATEDQIKPYSYTLDSLDIEQLRVSFRFSGLPKAAFPRFLDSHRLAASLKAFAATDLDATRTESDVASAALFDAHPFAVQTARFPQAILHLPFEYILSQLPQPSVEQPAYSEDDQANIETVINLSGILRAMRPPMCWGKGDDSDNTSVLAPNTTQETPCRIPMFYQPNIGVQTLLKLEPFIQDLKALVETIRVSAEGSPVAVMVKGIDALLSRFWQEAETYEGLRLFQRQQLACAYSKNWALTKGIGEEVLSSTLAALDANGRLLISEWRRASERIYKFVTHHLSSNGFGNKVTLVVTDSRCNLHLTSRGCVERPVRLPVALKAAKQVGAGTKDNVQLVTSVDDRYLKFAENCVLPKAHKTHYLRRMKNRCSLLKPVDVAPLTEDSDGNGGEDTFGSRGTWTAAVAAIATAIYAVDRIVAGECVNAFCASRPPGHHAGRELHPMTAISNGFCVLNTAACAALYATTPVSEGGPGLRRVCVIDFDVHHGNGTQDILCSTYDPRFLYISLHAGGAHINGYEDKDAEEQELDTLGSKRQEGIYPGRSGDSSPHLGVVNIPLGARVTSIGVGGAMVDVVRPAVDAFSPDLIILSAGFDAHKNDPLGLGGMTAEDFGTLTDVVCKLALRICSGRVLSVLEGGYGIPCCGIQENTFLPSNLKQPMSDENVTSESEDNVAANDGQPAEQQPVTQAAKQSRLPGSETQPKILELGEDLPPGMRDEVPANLQRRLEKCHSEGFIDCVRHHVQSLVNCNARSE